MIDIHAHILPFVDDGAETLHAAMEMLYKAKEQGISKIILTPHALRKDMPFNLKKDIVPAFETFVKQVQEQGIDITLYLGQEVAFHERIFDYLKDDQIVSLNNSDFVLFELPYSECITSLEDLILNFSYHKYILIFAHIERYDYFNVKELEALKGEFDIRFQVNANSILSKNSPYYKKAHKLLKKKLVDFVASDGHYHRQTSLLDAYTLVSKKYGAAYADEIFQKNQEKIINPSNS